MTVGKPKGRKKKKKKKRERERKRKSYLPVKQKVETVLKATRKHFPPVFIVHSPILLTKTFS